MQSSAGSGTDDHLTSVESLLMEAQDAWLKDDHGRALELVSLAFQHNALADNSREAFDLHILDGRLARSAGNLDAAAASFASAVEVARQLGDVCSELLAVNLRASAVNGLGQ